MLFLLFKAKQPCSPRHHEVSQEALGKTARESHRSPRTALPFKCLLEIRTEVKCLFTAGRQRNVLDMSKAI